MKNRLAGFLMRRGLLAARAVLVQFQAIRSVAPVFLRDVVALLAFRARQRNLRANVFRFCSHFFLLSLLSCPDPANPRGTPQVRFRSGGGIRTLDLTIMSRALSPTELPRLAAQRREPSSVKRAPAENRTLDLLLTMETLCRRSYRGNDSLVYRILPLVTN